MLNLVVLMWICVPILIVAVLVFAVLQERKRKRELEAVATELGLTYSTKLEPPDQSIFDRFPLAQIGHGRSASNAIVADSGELRMVIFDYTYITGGGKHKKTHRQSVVLATSPTLKLPQFTIVPESFFHRIGDLLGFKDIDFQDDVEFSKSFLLKGPDEPAIRDLFEPDRRAAFMKFKHVSVQAAGESFIFFQRRKLRGVEQLRELMQEGFSVFSAMSAGSQFTPTAE